MNNLTLTLPVTPTAFHRFAMNAQAEGISIEAYLARVSQRAFGVQIEQVVSTLFEDAISDGAILARSSAHDAAA